MKASIITIGDEILLGQILDTNSRYLADCLARIGVETVRMYSISDTATEILRTVEEAFAESEVTLVTGGLGPTQDDITKKTLAEYFGTELVFYPQVYEWVKESLSHSANSTMNPYNQSQAFLPKDCIVLHNRKGTASGMWFEKGGKVLICLPGVPFEAEHLMQAEVLPRLEKRLAGDLLRYKMLTVFDVPEATLALDLKAYEDTLPEGISLAYLPSAGYVRLRLTAKAVAEQKLEQCWQELVSALKGKNFSTEVQANPAALFAKEIKKHAVTVATAESCTGGKVAHLITAEAGASAYFLGGVVAYANEVKINVLGVSAEDLKKYGAVSESVAVQMAQGARRVTGADYAVSTTGVAGPDGGTPQKPVGTVWIGVAGPDGAYAQAFHFSAVRERNIAKASAKALALLLQAIQKDLA